MAKDDEELAEINEYSPTSPVYSPTSPAYVPTSPVDFTPIDAQSPVKQESATTETEPKIEKKMILSFADSDDEETDDESDEE